MEILTNVNKYINAYPTYCFYHQQLGNKALSCSFPTGNVRAGPARLADAARHEGRGPTHQTRQRGTEYVLKEMAAKKRPRLAEKDNRHQPR